jgi:uncharacterized membrane protein YeaQ/YmgE (transglycosylase-associated protein family)
MHILWMILIGFVIGLLARLLMPGDDSHGIVITTLLGIAGSVAASYAGQALGWYAEGQPAGFLASVLGAIALLAVARLFRKKQA